MSLTLPLDVPVVRQARLRPAHTAPRPTEAPWTLDVLGEPAIAFVVLGEPAPQGSKSYKGMRKGKGGKQVPILAESSAKVAPWRQDVSAVALEATNVPGWTSLDGPLVVDMVFTMPKGSSLARWLNWHERQPDLSKLARSTEDALTGSVWSDDSKVTEYRRLAKFFVGGDDPDVLRAPGAVIRVWRVPTALVDQRKAFVRVRR